MSEATYDLVVIGGGPGGYVAAIKAAQLGLTPRAAAWGLRRALRIAAMRLAASCFFTASKDTAFTPK